MILRITRRNDMKRLFSKHDFINHSLTGVQSKTYVWSQFSNLW